MKSVLPLVMLSSLLAGRALAEEPVFFADEKLKAAVEKALWVSDPTPMDMLGLTSLNVDNKGIGNLTGMEYATNLTSLVIRWNHITDLSPLSGLLSLRELDAHNNGLTEISPLSGLVNLRTLVLRINHLRDISALSSLVLLEDLRLEWNSIIDISPLSGMTHLRSVDLRSNKIRDISALVGLPSLKIVDLRGNPLSKESYELLIPQMLADKPSLRIQYDETNIKRRLEIGCGPGGSVTFPGEGKFVYDNGTSVRLQAEARRGFCFSSWSGSYPSQYNPLIITMNMDYQIRANFVSVLDTIHVDDNAPDDSRPGDATGSDPAEDGSAQHPFDQIQEAIQVAADGATILVHPGTYQESIDFLGKSIEIKGQNSEDPNEMAWPAIQGVPGKPVVSFTGGKDASCLLGGFVLTGGNGPLIGGVVCSRSHPTIVNCLIVGNRTSDPNGAIVYCLESNAVLVNCTIADNQAGAQGATLRSVDSHASVVNSILWGNALREIVQVGTGGVSVKYSAIAGGWSGLGCINADPLFAGAGYWADPNDPNTLLGPDDPNAIWVMGDYHVQSQAGRWDPKAHEWVRDAATSPCIDGGDPSSPVGQEPSPDGGIINMGAYGGMPDASKSFSGISSL